MVLVFPDFSGVVVDSVVDSVDTPDLALARGPTRLLATESYWVKKIKKYIS